VDDDELIVSFEACRVEPEAFDPRRDRRETLFSDRARRTTTETFAFYDSTTCGSNE
jgi:hypothetical protein